MTLTPYEIFTKKKPKIPAYAFGTIAVAHHPRSEDKSIRAEIGIFISHGYNLRYLKFWIPTRHQMYSMRSMIPLKNQVTPPSWNYPQNVRGNLPIQRPPGDQSTTRSTMTQPPTEILDKTANEDPALVPIVDPTIINNDNGRKQVITHPTSGDIGPTITEN